MSFPAPSRLAALACVAALLPPCARAQGAEPAPRATPEPQIERIVQQDDNVRIEELRVRGVTQSITVNAKAGGTASRYQIRTGDGSDADRERHGAGRSAWRLFSF
jgi:hypothetical protein